METTLVERVEETTRKQRPLSTTPQAEAIAELTAEIGDLVKRVAALEQTVQELQPALRNRPGLEASRSAEESMLPPEFRRRFRPGARPLRM